MTLTAEAQHRVVVLCRSQDRRALLERLVGASETFPSAVDACLAVARRPARAVVVNLEDVEGVEREIVAAMRHAQPDLPIYALVKPEDEPLGRRLLREGAADYFVLPTDVARLPGILSAEGGTRSVT